MFLVCENIASLLPTIKSRCIVVRFNPINKQQMRRYLENKGIRGVQQEIYEKLSDGSIGVVNDIIQDETYMEVRRQSIKYLERLDKAQIMEIYDIVKEVIEQKEDMERVLQFWLYWYRDIAIVKAANSDDLYYRCFYEKCNHFFGLSNM